MYLLRAIVRPEKSSVVMKALFDAGFPAVTKLSVFGRGKQRGLKVGNVTYDELPKDLLMIVIPEKIRILLLKQSWKLPVQEKKDSLATEKYSLLR